MMKFLVFGFMSFFALASTAELAWPADFHLRMEKRIQETTPLGVESELDSSSDEIVIFSGTMKSSETYGDESEPLETVHFTIAMIT
jgi:hypothetical protein